MSQTLMVGVSGVRGLVGKDLTPELVAHYAAAFGAWARGDRKKAAVVLGRDARTSGPMYSLAATAGLLSVGCEVIDIGLVSTPGAQLAVEHHHAAGGIVLTASHNPIEWNALKFIGPDGVFLDAAAGAGMRVLLEDGRLTRAGYDGLGSIRQDDGANARHLAQVLALPVVPVAKIRRRKFHVALDTVRGAGGAFMPELLKRLGCRVTAINLPTDGRFPRPPEPTPNHLGALSRLVRKSKADVGIAVDPDVDRLAIVDETGRPIGEDYTLAFAVRAVLGAGRSGGRAAGKHSSSARPPVRPTVVVNLSTSLVVDDAAREYGADVVRVAVGEVNVARAMLERRAVIGGEGNGGVILPSLHAGRDAPLAAALVLALLARDGRTVSEIVETAPRYEIVKDKIPRGAALGAVYSALKQRFADATTDEQDGLRLAWPDRWLHVRPSNTEPIIRLIAEAPTRALAIALVEEGRRACAAS
jgi:phosphomannomutase